jgi:hypothetical protein
MPTRYDRMKTEDFDRLLAEEMDRANAKASDLLTIPGIYDIVSEYYNNAVLEAWDLEQERDEEETRDEA